MKFQISQPIESTSQFSPDGQPNEPPEKGLHHPPQKRTPTKCTKKLAAFRTLAREAVAERYEQKGDPGELSYLPLHDRACLLLRLSCSFCGRCC